MLFLNKFYKKKKVLITGHTGFKGSWLTTILCLFGAKVYGISLDTKKDSHYKVLNLKKVKNNFFDITNFKKLNNCIKKIKPEFIFHLAAQSLVSESLRNPITTWETNVIGTLNLLESIKQIKHKCSVVIITSDKCYLNIEKQVGYKENDTLGGKDPYSASKASAENVFLSEYNSFFKEKKNFRIATARAGNVIGGGDWSKDRIVPDFFKSIINKKKLKVRNPNSIRPWQHVLEPLLGYLLLSYNLYKKKSLSGKSFNFGPKLFFKKKVIDVLKKLQKRVPYSRWEIKRQNKNKETKTLILDSSYALKKLGWKTKLDFNKTISMTSEWYYQFIYKKKVITLSQIKSYLGI